MTKKIILCEYDHSSNHSGSIGYQGDYIKPIGWFDSEELADSWVQNGQNRLWISLLKLRKELGNYESAKISKIASEKMDEYEREKKSIENHILIIEDEIRNNNLSDNTSRIEKLDEYQLELDTLEYKYGLY